LGLGEIYSKVAPHLRKKFAEETLTRFIDRSFSVWIPSESVYRFNHEEDRTLIEYTRSFVQNQPKKKQLDFLDFADESVRLNLHSCAYQLAHRAEFSPDMPLGVSVLVCGEAGAGKSTLINQSLRDALPIEDQCKEGVGGSGITMDLEEKSVVYKRLVKPSEIERGFLPDTELEITISFIDTPGFGREEDHPELAATATTTKIFERISHGILRDHSQAVDIVLWVMSGSSSRLPKFDEVFIRTLNGFVPVGLVWTRALLNRHIDGFQSYLADKTQVKTLLPIEFTHRVYAREESTCLQGIESFGMAELGILLGDTFNDRAKQLKSEYINKHECLTEQDFAQRRADSYRVVRYYSFSCGIVAGSPIPYVDNVIVFALQSAMILQINKKYGVSLPKNLIGSMVTSVVSGGSVWSMGVIGMYLLDIGVDTMKLLPGLNVVAMGIGATLGAGLTAALGCAFINAVEKLARDYPSLLDIPEDRIEKVLLEECANQGKRTYREAHDQVEASCFQ